jgi:uracil-DNA glycosylase
MPPIRKDRGSSRVTLSAVRQDAKACRRCDLWRRATQTVFGEGPRGGRIMLVGEQPGDAEDREGRPLLALRGSCFGARSRKPASIPPTST